jgi:hypothetical protein
LQQNFGSQCCRDCDRERNQESDKTTPAACGLVKQGGNTGEVAPQLGKGGESLPGTRHKGRSPIARQIFGFSCRNSLRLRWFEGLRRNGAFLPQFLHNGVADRLHKGAELRFGHSGRRAQDRRLGARSGDEGEEE